MQGKRRAWRNRLQRYHQSRLLVPRLLTRKRRVATAFFSSLMVNAGSLITMMATASKSSRKAISLVSQKSSKASASASSATSSQTARR